MPRGCDLPNPDCRKFFKTRNPFLQQKKNHKNRKGEKKRWKGYLYVKRN